MAITHAPSWGYDTVILWKYLRRKPEGLMPRLAFWRVLGSNRYVQSTESALVLPLWSPVTPGHSCHSCCFPYWQNTLRDPRNLLLINTGDPQFIHTCLLMFRLVHNLHFLRTPQHHSSASQHIHLISRVRPPTWLRNTLYKHNLSIFPRGLM